MSGEKVLLVEENRQRAEVIENRLARAGFEVVCACGDREALECARSKAPDLIVVDEASSEIDAPRVSRCFRESPETRHARIVVLSPGESGCSLSECREAGVDQCVKSPLPPEEIVDYLEEALSNWVRRFALPRGLRFEQGGLVIDTDRHEVLFRGREVSLTLREFQLLVALARAEGRVMSRGELLSALRLEGRVDERNVDVHITSIRKKLGEGARRVATVFGVGYKLRAED